MHENDLQAEIESLETARGKALLREDWNALAALVSPGLVHIHANGALEDCEAYLEGVRTRLAFKTFERESYRVRGYGDHAIATGVLKQIVLDRTSGARFDIRVITTQVWVKNAQGWQQTSFHATHLPKT
jgi:ketosteroid isomerase-like protein